MVNHYIDRNNSLDIRRPVIYHMEVDAGTLKLFLNDVCVLYIDKHGNFFKNQLTEEDACQAGIRLNNNGYIL